jgi:arylsulfatase
MLTPLASGFAAPDPHHRARRAIEAHDQAIHLHDAWVRDPFIVLAQDGFYYYTGTTQEADLPVTDESQANTGLGPTSLVGWHIRAWRSKDLITWESMGSPASLKDSIWYEAARGIFDSTPQNLWKIWAPELHRIHDRWAIVFTTPAPLKPAVGASLLLSSGSDLRGPWENPLGDRIGIRADPSLFRDDDGTWWMIWGATTIAPLKPDLSNYAGPELDIHLAGAFPKIGHEGCTILKIFGRYVLFGTGWSTGQMRKGSYNLYYATASKITGPYSERRFVGRFLGHGTPFQDKKGRWWCTAFYNANIPPLPGDHIEERDLAENAQTINRQGLTIVPLSMRFVDGDVVIRASDPLYGTPGPDELQQFSRASEAISERR